MVGIIVLVPIVCVAAAVAVTWVIVRRDRVRWSHLLDDPAVAQALRSARQRSLLAAVLAAAVLVGGLTAWDLRPRTLGLPFVVAPGLAAAIGLSCHALLPAPVAPVDGATVRQAALAPRRVWTFVPRRSLAWACCLVAANVALLVVAGVTAGPDSRSFTVVHGNRSGTSGPYPGWYYGWPVLVSTALLVAATVAALARVAQTPSLPRQGLDPADRAWRAASSRSIMLLATGMLSLQLAGLMFMASQSWTSASRVLAPSTLITGLLVGAWTLTATALAAGVVRYALAAVALLAPVDLDGPIGPDVDTAAPHDARPAGMVEPGIEASR